MSTSKSNKAKAKELYTQGYSVAEISDQLEIPYATVSSWKKRDGWDELRVVDKVESQIDTRLCQLIAKDSKTDRDLKEIELLYKGMESLARQKKYEQTGKESNINPKRKRKGVKKNGDILFDEKAIKSIKESFQDNLFDYQKNWFSAIEQPVRNILKSRQIGATYYFAREAAWDAIVNGKNQIFLSASKAQAYVFREYIKEFVQEATGIDLKGDPIDLKNGAKLYFLGTSYRSAQTYHGNLYFDEYFWTNGFKRLQKVASGMALHAQWRETYFSTPSTVNHEAYSFWTGSQYNRGRKRSEHIDIDVSHQSLKDGRLCEDGQWKQVVTVMDALAGGCNLFDLKQVRLKYSEEDFKNLLMCHFIDDALSVFKLEKLQKCMVDSWEVWEDFSPLSLRPYGDHGVWVGYDPSRTRDDASLVVVAPPLVAGGKYRVLEKHSWNNLNFNQQADRIKKIGEQYNIEYMAIDVSGLGIGVYDIVKTFYPAVVPIKYSVEVKNRLVLKALNIIDSGRLEFDNGWSDLAMAFMTIHKTTTRSGTQISYQASRTQETGHADIAWALMHAIDKEQLANTGRMQHTASHTDSFLEIF